MVKHREDCNKLCVRESIQPQQDLRVIPSSLEKVVLEGVWSNQFLMPPNLPLPAQAPSWGCMCDCCRPVLLSPLHPCTHTIGCPQPSRGPASESGVEGPALHNSRRWHSYPSPRAWHLHGCTVCSLALPEQIHSVRHPDGQPDQQLHTSICPQLSGKFVVNGFIVLSGTAPTEQTIPFRGSVLGQQENSVEEWQTESVSQEKRWEATWGSPTRGARIVTSSRTAGTPWKLHVSDGLSFPPRSTVGQKWHLLCLTW